MKHMLYILPVLLFAAVAAYLYAGLSRDPEMLPSALIGRPAPEFALPPLPGHTGNGLATADVKTGEPVLVNVFASWCVPCRAEHPLLMRLAESGITIHGLAYKDRPEASLAFLHELGDPYGRIGMDREGQVGIEWGVYGVPETYVVDGAGIIRYRYAGPLTPEEVERNLLPLLRTLRG